MVASIDMVVLCGLFLLFSLAEMHENMGEFIKSLAVVALSCFMFTMRGEVILDQREARYYQIAVIVLRKISNSCLLAAVVLFLGKFYFIGWWKFLACYVLTFFVSLGIRFTLRYFVKEYFRRPENTFNVVLVGMTRNNIEIYKQFVNSAEIGFRVVGYFSDEECPDIPSLCPRLGTPSQVVEYLAAHPDMGLRELYCCLPSTRSEEIKGIINYCEGHFINFLSVPNLSNYMLGSVELRNVGSVPVLSLYNTPLNSVVKRLQKRIFDILFSALFLCTLFPVILLVVTIITKLTMPGPVFFRQKRNGINGKEFECLKFRSMKVNDDADRLQATKNDPRKTRWGNIMRKTNIDELPQFINVLMGDMSVVGPRPHMLKHTEEYSQIVNHYMVRHLVKPGITGWSQVTGFRGETKEVAQMEGRVQGDIWYIENWSFYLDIYIIYRTIFNSIVGEKNAY